MKKNLLVLCSTLLFAQSIFAQITLTASGYTGTYVGVTDTFLNSATTTVLTPIAPATNAMWNLFAEVDTTPIYYITSYPPSTTPMAQFGLAEVALFSGINVNEFLECGVSATSYARYGDSVYRQPNSISGLTGGAHDSIIFDAQNIIFSSPEILINFPATYMSNWTSTFRSVFNVQLDVASYALSNTPCFEVSYLTYKDTVVGWGQMQVKELNGDTSGTCSVLQIKEIVTEEDSFYLSGPPASPAPTALLTAFGVTQGQISNYYYQHYYRVGEVAPLANVTYSNSSYDTNKNVETHTQRLPALGLPQMPGSIAVNIYPNPVTNHTVNIDMPGAQNGNYTYEFIDMMGEKVLTGTLADQSHTLVPLPQSLTTGIYFIRIKNNDKEVAVRPLEIK